MPPWNAAKAKVQLRLSVQRLRTLQEKKQAQAKASRRDIATLIERGRVETSKIKVEGLILEDIYVELLELLELYCELLIARFGVLDQNARAPDPGVSEGVCSIIYAAPRTEVKELHVVRDLLMHKYGRDFAVSVMENQDGCVNDRVVRKLDVITPSAELVDAYLAEIARGYGVDYASFASEHKQGEGVDTTDNEGSGSDDGGVKEKTKETAGATPVSGIPLDRRPSAAEGTPKLPDLPPTEDAEGEKVNGTKKSQEKSLTADDDFEALQKRFAALKKR